MYYTYILLSEKDHERYAGSTNNLSRRLDEHNQGKVQSTKNRRPLKLIYFEEYQTEKEARCREKYFKTHKGYNELKKIIGL
jgi:putative endonuclease